MTSCAILSAAHYHILMVLLYSLSSIIWHDSLALLHLENHGFEVRPLHCDVFLDFVVKSQSNELSIPQDIEHLMLTQDPLLIFVSCLLLSQTASVASAMYA